MSKIPSILFIDDDPNMHRLIEFFLKKENVQIEGVHSGRMALKKLSSNNYDLIISDIQMPEMDGITLIKDIRQRNINIPVVIISAYGLEEMTERVHEAEAVRILSKPFNSNDLITTIRESLTQNESA